MAIWLVLQQRQKTSVQYVNLQTQQVIPCGDQRVDTPIGMILDWIAEHSDPGDAALVNGHSVMFKQQAASA